MDNQNLASDYFKTFSPSHNQESVNKSKFREIIDIDDDGDFDAVDVAILAGIAFAGYLAFSFAFKMMKRG